MVCGFLCPMDQTWLITAYTHIKGHSVAQLKLIMRVVPSKGFAPKPISDVFLTYVQQFDIVPQVNPMFSLRAGPFPEPASAMFVLRRATCAGGAPLGDIIPLTQVCAFADLIPRFGSKADTRLTKQSSSAYSLEFWLNKYFGKELYFALTLT